MNTPSETIFRTNYFTKPLTWVVRFVQFFIAVTVLFLVDLSEMTDGIQLLMVCAPLLALAFLAFPVDEVTLDKDNLHFIKKSIVPFLNSTRHYKISEIKRMGFYSMAGVAGVFGLLVPVTSVFRIEFTFQDDSSKSDDVFIHRGDLKNVVSEVRELIESAGS
jgi:hypothetical protein